MDIERRFEDLGVDAVTGVRLMRSLGLSTEDFVDESRFLRFKDIIDYFKDIPNSDGIVHKITIGKIVDKLDHVWGYTQLLKNKRENLKEAETLISKLDLLENIDGQEFAVNEINEKLARIQVETTELENQIDKYD